MERQSYVLINDHLRGNALAAVRNAPTGCRVVISDRSRSTDQNAKMWAMLSDVARAAPEDRHWTPETWKAAFMHFLGHQVLFAEGLDNAGPFPVGFRSSQLTVKQMGDLITCIYEYGDRNGVEWRETEKSGFLDDARAA